MKEMINQIVKIETILCHQEEKSFTVIVSLYQSGRVSSDEIVEIKLEWRPATGSRF